MRMLTAARGAVPGLAPGKPNVEYIAMDGTLHAVPLADAARRPAGRGLPVMLQSLLRRPAILPVPYSADPEWAHSEPGPRSHLARTSPAGKDRRLT
jgi:hypothetical protein